VTLLQKFWSELEIWPVKLVEEEDVAGACLSGTELEEEELLDLRLRSISANSVSGSKTSILELEEEDCLFSSVPTR